MFNTIRRCLFGLLLALEAALGTGSQAACIAAPEPLQLSPEQARAAMAQARDHGFLWRISKGAHSSYLYGTIHVAKKDWMFPGPQLMQALLASDTVALELNLLDGDIRARLASGMAAVHGAALPEPLVRRMQAQAELLCVPYATLAPALPEVQIAILTLMAARQDGLEASYAMDVVLAGMGRGLKKEVVSLETPELQLQTLQMHDAQETIAYVEESLDELQSERSRLFLTRLTQVWASADHEQMAHFHDWCECMDSRIEREFMKRTVDDRNPAMAQRIDALHRGARKVFAAVGSLHMVGPQGLPALMENLGYQVERIPFRSP